MKTADEMFKGLGWELVNKISYQEKITCVIYQNDYLNELKFDFINKTFQADNSEGGTIEITMQELQAINKKCQELGWID